MYFTRKWLLLCALLYVVSPQTTTGTTTTTATTPAITPATTVATTTATNAATTTAATTTATTTTTAATTTTTSVTDPTQAPSVAPTVHPPPTELEDLPAYNETDTLEYELTGEQKFGMENYDDPNDFVEEYQEIKLPSEIEKEQTALKTFYHSTNGIYWLKNWDFTNVCSFV